jgi:transposase
LDSKGSLLLEKDRNIPFTLANFNSLIALVAELRVEIASLKSQLKTDSHNSSKPPSSDGLKKKNINLRRRSGKPSGGQSGHKGRTLSFEGIADKVVYHMPFETCGCGNEYLKTKETVVHEIDLPVIRETVTTHKQVHYHCTQCGATYSGKGIRGHNVQYGPNIKSMALYLKDYHFVPYQRLATFFKDCFALSISQGTLSNFTAKAYETLGSFEQLVKVNLLKSPVVHSDETGMRAEGKTKWMHVASNNEFTYYHFESFAKLKLN